MIIDAHHHLWQIGRNGHEWPTPNLGAIYRDYGMPDLLDAAQGLGIIVTILVQSQPCDADTDWMLEITAEAALVAAVVGWADMTAPGAPERIRHIASHSKLKGLRPMLQGLTDDEWILQPAVRPALAAMLESSLTFDALVFPRHLPVIDRLAKLWPELSIVIDHGAKPPIGARDPDPFRTWRDGLSRVAENANVCCKLSGLLTEMKPGQSLDDLEPYADHMLAAFGAERLMWGSDWPVVDLNGSYRAWFDWTQGWLADKPAAVRDNIMGETARRFYALAIP